MTKTQTKITVGDTVRSYDFPGNESCYLEGVVVAVGTFPENPRLGDCMRYKIEVHKQVWANEVVTTKFSNDYVYPPVNGLKGMFGLTCEVSRVNDTTLEAMERECNRPVPYGC